MQESDATTQLGLVYLVGIASARTMQMEPCYLHCTEHQLAITNTVFQQADKRKTTWMHPCSGHWHLIDYVIVPQRDQSDVKLTRAMRGATMWSDHRLVTRQIQTATEHQAHASAETTGSSPEVQCLQPEV